MSKSYIKKMVKIKKKLVKSPKKFKKPVKVTTKKQEDYSAMTVDDFLKQDFEQSNSEVSSEEIDVDAEPERKVEEDEIADHKKALSKLRYTDPEFYKFLQDNDQKLLQFNVSDDENDEDEESAPHRPPQELEVASDESDFEESDEVPDSGVVTLKLLKTWENLIQTDKSNKTVVALIQAFHAALLTVSSEEQEPSPYKVEGSAVFNGVIQLCVLHLGPALRRFLRITGSSKQPPHKCKKFTKIKGTLKDYFVDLAKLLGGVTSPNIQTVLLKHLHYMSAFIASYPKVTKTILKRLIAIWGNASEGVRVISFFCILHITNNQKMKFLEIVLKAMYITYVKNSKFVSIGSLAGINFMRRSLVEMYALDADVSYQQVFLYVRQLAINLRNAITVNKKENIQAVYNWQYVNSLKLWGNLLSVTHHKPVLQQLVYPFVQVCLGVLKLLPTAQYYPLRFHVIQILMDLSRDTGVFIPVLPFILEVLAFDFNKKHQKVSMKPLQFTCMLRASKSQMAENGFKDALVEHIYALSLEYLAAHSHSIAFPDLALVCTVQIKQFVKKCSNANYKRKMKQLLEKIEQNSQFVEGERTKVTLSITDFKQIEGWEAQIKAKGTPLATYFEEWNKLHAMKKNKEATNNDELGDYKLPRVTKKKVVKVRQEGPVDLFPSDSDDEATEERRKRGKRGGKKAQKRIKDEGEVVQDDGEADIVEDLKISDW